MGTSGKRGTFGTLLRRHRLAAGLTQEALAERSRLSAQAVGALERGERRSPYRSTVDLLAEALRLSPADRRELAAAARRWGPARGDDVPGTALPTPPVPLLGREADVELATDLLRRPHVRLLTLTGAPGVGKTRLGLAVAAALAADFPGPVVFVPLASLADPDLVVSTVGRAVGMPESPAAPLDALVAHIGARPALVVMDNFEHLLPATPALAGLLERCPSLRLLVTSRAALNLRGEHQLRVRPLPVPAAEEASLDELARVPSVALFVQRAQAVSPELRLTPDNAPLVAEACRRLEGLPLALELAAARTRLLPPDALLERLSDRLRLLVGGPRDVPEHQRTMRATLEWSYELLSAGERVLFRRLSVFRGGARAEALESVCLAAGPLPGQVLDTLGGLVDKSLVQTEIHQGDLRATMLETVRTYAGELLTETAEAAATSHAHASYCLRLAETADEALKGRDQPAWLDRLEREHDNLRAALGWARDVRQVELGLALAGRLGPFWRRRGHTREGLAWLDELLATAGAASPRTRARALMAAGALCSWHDPPGGRKRFEASLALYRSLGDRDGISRALGNLGIVAQDGDDHHRAVALFDECLDISRSLGNDHRVSHGLLNMAFSVLELGDLRRAAVMLEEAAAIQRRLGDAVGLASSLTYLGVAAGRAGDHPRSSAAMDESIRLCRDLGDEVRLAYVLAHRGYAARAAGGDPSAVADLAEALSIGRRLCVPRVVIMCIACVAAVAATRRAPAVAARLHGAATVLREQYALPISVARNALRSVEELIEGSGLDGARSEGRRLSLDQAAHEALAWTRDHARD